VRVRGVLETCLYTGTLEATARFYQEVLGLEPLSRVPGRHAFFRCGEGVLLLFDPARTEVAGGEVPPHGARGPGHVAFHVPQEELDAWRSRLRSLRVEVESEVRWPRGGRSLYLRDPAGNSVELTSPAIWGLEAGGAGRPE
jgi:catechol 2,3-dioxygenase-like lactoylglutathione lyase family enzyme